MSGALVVTIVRAPGCDPVVRDAVEAVALFAGGCPSPRVAATLLGLWRDRDRLTDRQVDQVLAAFAPEPAVPVDERGYGYSRPVDELVVDPVPPYVEGQRLSGRSR